MDVVWTSFNTILYVPTEFHKCFELLINVKVPLINNLISNKGDCYLSENEAHISNFN